MRQPTITKQQAIAALVELRRRDFDEQHAEWLKESERLAKAIEDECYACLADPDRRDYVFMDEDSETGECHKLAIGNPAYVPVDFTRDLRVKAWNELNNEHNQRCPRFNEGEMARYLEDKLTGCDPESLLSVPSNVEKMRALLNGLQLLPEPYETLANQ